MRVRRTRILATLGPASDTPERIRALIDAGVDAFRLNFSHGTIETHTIAVGRVREAARAAGRPVAIVQDLPGPKIRIGDLRTPATLVEGEKLIIDRGDFAGDADRVSCAFDALFTSVSAGDRLLVDDGRIELRVTEATPDRLVTIVSAGGPLSAHKGINVPDVAMRTAAITAHDEALLAAGISMGVDAVAVSFVQTAEDIRTAKRVAAAAGAPDLPVIAKIERPQAVSAIEEILDECDGLMVARGDLGIEMPLESIPAVQRALVLAARRRGVPVILATQVLESMCTEPRPTRAEVTDAAHAVDEGVDAIMLAGETAAGRYPIKSVSTLAAIIVEAERNLKLGLTAIGSASASVVRPDDGAHGPALCDAAVTLAEHAHAAAIVAVTAMGKTARVLAALRPAATILAATVSPETAARLSLVWGVTPFVTSATTIEAIREALVTQSLVSPGSVVVFVGIRPTLERDRTNFVHIERI